MRSLKAGVFHDREKNHDFFYKPSQIDGNITIPGPYYQVSMVLLYSVWTWYTQQAPRSNRRRFHTQTNFYNLTNIDIPALSDNPVANYIYIYINIVSKFPNQCPRLRMYWFHCWHPKLGTVNELRMYQRQPSTCSGEGSGSGVVWWTFVFISGEYTEVTKRYIITRLISVRWMSFKVMLSNIWYIYIWMSLRSSLAIAFVCLYDSCSKSFAYQHAVIIITWSSIHWFAA